VSRRTAVGGSGGGLALPAASMSSASHPASVSAITAIFRVVRVDPAIVLTR